MYRYRGGMKMLDSNRVEMDLKPQTRHGRQKKRETGDEETKLEQSREKKDFKRTRAG